MRPLVHPFCLGPSPGLRPARPSRTAQAKGRGLASAHVVFKLRMSLAEPALEATGLRRVGVEDLHAARGFVNPPRQLAGGVVLAAGLVTDIVAVDGRVILRCKARTEVETRACHGRGDASHRGSLRAHRRATSGCPLDAVKCISTQGLHIARPGAHFEVKAGDGVLARDDLGDEFAVRRGRPLVVLRCSMGWRSALVHAAANRGGDGCLNRVPRPPTWRDARLLRLRLWPCVVRAGGPMN